MQKENNYYICYINRVDTDIDSDIIEEEQHLNTDVEINTPNINRLREKIINYFCDVVTTRVLRKRL